MKQTFLFSILIICISCFSCEKEKLKGEEKDYKESIVGDYDWEESTTGEYYPYSTIITHSPSTTGNNYGFRIKKNYNIFLYENGKQIKKGKLKEITKESYFIPDSYASETGTFIYYHKITFIFEGESITLYDENGMSCKTWPYNNSPNFFKKIK